MTEEQGPQAKEGSLLPDEALVAEFQEVSNQFLDVLQRMVREEPLPSPDRVTCRIGSVTCKVGQGEMKDIGVQKS